MSHDRIYQIYTIQLSQSRLAELRIIPVVDITVKSGIEAFAPTWDMVMAAKRSIANHEHYTRLYLEKMAESKQRYPEEWKKLAGMEVVALACYCRAGVFCHRHLLKNLLLEDYRSMGYTAVDMGEIIHATSYHPF